MRLLHFTCTYIKQSDSRYLNMKKIITPVLKYIIDNVKRNKFVQDVFESPINLTKFGVMGNFKDSQGTTHTLYDNLRTKIKPTWKKSLSDKKPEVGDLNIAKLKEISLLQMDKVEKILNTYGKSIKNSDIIEIGCHSGANSLAMAEFGASSVRGTEFNGYKVSSLSSEDANDVSKLKEVDEFLEGVRARLKKEYALEKNNIEFLNDDICNSKLNPNSADVICSWDVLEHLHDPQGAFDSFYEILKEGGMVVHHYNPFFSLNGGHSMCTLDFLWGHCRLSDQDFEKYVKEIRPNEVEKALSFYRDGLNRMTLADLNEIVVKSGMKVLGIVPMIKEQHFRMVDADILNQTSKLYPNLEINDLIAPNVIVIAQK